MCHLSYGLKVKVVTKKTKKKTKYLTVSLVTTFLATLTSFFKGPLLCEARKESLERQAKRKTDKQRKLGETLMR